MQCKSGTIGDDIGIDTSLDNTCDTMATSPFCTPDWGWSSNIFDPERWKNERWKINIVDCSMNSIRYIFWNWGL